MNREKCPTCGRYKEKEVEDPRLEELMERHYPIMLVPHYDDGETWYFGYFPDLGASACSYIGETAGEVFLGLRRIQRDVFLHYLASGKEIPKPSKPVPNLGDQ